MKHKMKVASVTTGGVQTFSQPYGVSPNHVLVLPAYSLFVEVLLEILTKLHLRGQYCNRGWRFYRWSGLIRSKVRRPQVAEVWFREEPVFSIIVGRTWKDHRFLVWTNSRIPRINMSSPDPYGIEMRRVKFERVWW